VTFAEMVYLMTRGELPTARLPARRRAGGGGRPRPQALSIAAARMAISWGRHQQRDGLGHHMLGDVHGGAGEQCVALYNAVAARIGDGPASERRLADAVAAEIAALAERGIRHVPGFGHRFHPRDPRAPRLLELVDAAAAAGAVSGRFAAIGRAVEARLEAQKGRPIPMNIDGATGVVLAELGFPPPLCRGLFVLSRSVGALAHAFEELESGTRNKGPILRDLI
jgi:citrate synthase